VTRWWQQ